MDVNQTFLPLLWKAQRTIVHIDSIASFASIPWCSIYCASKAALYAYCDTLRLEVASLEVKVVYIQTRTIKSNMTASRNTIATNSLYAPMRKAYEESRKTDGELGVTTEAYAKEVVENLLSPGS